MCEIRLTKLSCTAQQVGIVHFYAVTEIKGLSCRLWWMREWRNLLTSTHVGYRSVIRAVASGTSLKFGVQGASATNWFSRVNGARDNGILLYTFYFTAVKLTVQSTDFRGFATYGLTFGSHQSLRTVVLNSLRPSDAYMGTWAQVMACCLTAPSNDWIQYWLMISEVLWHSLKGSFTGNGQGPLIWF